jgi:hypothetical protein
MTETLWAVVIGGLIGGLPVVASTWIGHRLQYKKESEFREHDSRLRFMERQLNELYAPMLGLLKQIRGLSESRLKFDRAGDDWWHKDVIPGIRNRTPEKAQADTTAMKQGIEYDNKQFEQVLLSKYRQMAEIFSRNYALAEPEVKDHYSAFIYYVEVWNRYMSPEHPREQFLHTEKHSEEILRPLYDHIKAHADRIAKSLSAARA